MRGLLDVMDDPTIKYESIVIWSEPAVFGICVKFASCFFHVVVDSKVTGFRFSMIQIGNFEEFYDILIACYY